MTTTKETEEPGEYVVADPRVCHGQLTFRGSRVPVDDVLKQVAAGDTWEAISAGTRGSVSHQAIAEAVRLAASALLEREPKNTSTEVRELGKYVIADPRICHGALTIRGTRVFVEHTLCFIAEDMPWEKITWEWRGSVSAEAISSAIDLARRALAKAQVLAAA